jgi:hypothetical protein
MTPTSPARGDVIRIEKLAPDGRPVIAYQGWLLTDDDPILLLARWDAPDLILPYTTFARGDLLLEAYFRQRPGNIFALFDGAHAPPDADWQHILQELPVPPTTLTSMQPLCQPLAVRCPLKGFYINFTRPVRYDPAARKLVWQDMALDLWIPAEGAPLLLDEEEYRALNVAESDPALARTIEDFRQELRHQAATHTGLFAPAASNPRS